MKIVEMLRRGAILVPLDAPDLQWALTSAFRAVPAVSDEVAKKLAADLVGGVSGEIHRVHERVVVALAESDAVEEISAIIGVSPARFTAEGAEAASGVDLAEVGAGGAPRPGTGSEMVLVLVTPRRLISLRDGVLPTLKRFFRTEQETFNAWIEIPAGRHELRVQVVEDGASSRYEQATAVKVGRGEVGKYKLIVGRAREPLSLNPE